MKINILLVLFLILKISTALGQDIHWSQFNAIPLFQNPGNTGHFNGDYRFVANYRNQWKSVTVPFSTFSVSADTHLKNAKKIGLGMLFFHDAVGDGKLRTIEFQASGSYLIKLSADSSHSIRPGISLGINYRQVNSNPFYFDNQFNGITFDPTLPTNEIYQSDTKINATIGLGAIYEYYKGKRQTITAGIGFYTRGLQGQLPRKTQHELVEVCPICAWSTTNAT